MPSSLKNIISVIMTVVLSVAIVAGTALAFRAFVYPDQEVDLESDTALIGGDKDEGGCLIGAGYAWCEVKQKCLRPWEELCLSEEDRQAVEDHIRTHISELSPEKEVLGGKFYVTDIKFYNQQALRVEYEDGHIALTADVTFSVDQGQVLVEKFTVIDK